MVFFSAKISMLSYRASIGWVGRSGTNDAYLCPLCCLSYMLLVNLMSMMLQYLLATLSSSDQSTLCTP